jgi:hypothetical protein
VAAQVLRDNRRKKAARVTERIRTMRNALLALSMLLAITIAGCKNNTTTPATSSATTSAAPATASTPSLTPEQLGELGASIHKHPSEGTKILSDRGLTQEQFERAIRQVSSDPEASKRYAAAYKRNV